MQVPNGSERFTFPQTQAANSPPVTPSSSTSSYHASPPTYASVAANGHKRYGFIAPPMLSPPENIAQVDGHKFSYSRPLGQSSSENGTDSSSDDSDDGDDESSCDEEQENLIGVPEAPQPPPTQVPMPQIRRSSIIIKSFDDDASILDFTIEEYTSLDMDYDSDADVVLPSQCEEFSSDDGEKADDKSETESSSSESEADSDEDSNSSLVGGIDGLQCDEREEIRKQEEAFEEKRRQQYLRKKKRWSKGGMRKRDITTSIGSDSDDTADITPLDDMNIVGVSARRLRRRTEGPEARPRTSLLFQDPPKEIEELRYLEEMEHGVAIESDDEFIPPWMYPMEIDAEDLDTDDELMLPSWMYPPITHPTMEVDADDTDDSD